MSEDASGFVCFAGKIPEWLCGCSGVFIDRDLKYHIREVTKNRL